MRVLIENILGTYSNLENHPKIIVEASNKIKLSAKTGMPLGVLAGRASLAAHDKEEDSEEYVIAANLRVQN